MKDDFTKTEVSEVKMVYVTKVKTSTRVQVTASDKVAEILFCCYDQQTIELSESFKVMYLNRANRVIAVQTISDGSTTGCIVDVSKVISGALLLNATGMILSHNHPSGNLKPSENDLIITKKIKGAAELFSITVLDHLIVNSDGEYYSFADEGKI